MNQTIIEFRNVQALVETILENDERARNCDKWLVYRVLRHFTNAYIPFEDFNKFPSFETVTRCRRKIQHTQGRLLPTDIDVYNQRQLRQASIKCWAKEG